MPSQHTWMLAVQRGNDIVQIATIQPPSLEQINDTYDRLRKLLDVDFLNGSEYFCFLRAMTELTHTTIKQTRELQEKGIDYLIGGACDFNQNLN